VPPSIVEELLNRKDERIFTGRDLPATILVCRIWNFSHFMEDLTPEQTLRYLNEFYAMARLVDRTPARRAAPLPRGRGRRHPHALRAAINIVRPVNLMQQKWAQQERRALRVGVGVNSGIVIAGDAGFANRREYTIVGPDVTLAPRLQAATFDLNAGRSCPTRRRRARPTKTTTGRRCRYEIRAALRAVRAQSLARSA
jgi:class 3 adenylate cyclase